MLHEMNTAFSARFVFVIFSVGAACHRLFYFVNFTLKEKRKWNLSM